MSSEYERAVKKLVSVSANSTPVTETREEAVRTAEVVENAEADKDGKRSKSEYQNLPQVPYIR